MSNVAGQFDENELVAESEGNEAGGSWTVTVRLSLAICPTTACTKAC